MVIRAKEGGKGRINYERLQVWTVNVDRGLCVSEEERTSLAGGVDVEGHGRGGARDGSQGCDLSTWLGNGALTGEDWCGAAGEHRLWFCHCVFRFGHVCHR